MKSIAVLSWVAAGPFLNASSGTSKVSVMGMFDCGACKSRNKVSAVNNAAAGEAKLLSVGTWLRCWLYILARMPAHFSTVTDLNHAMARTHARSVSRKEVCGMDYPNMGINA
jgi:hypothetical protein